MYKHLLLPTDGSALSRHAVESGIRLASALGARVTVFHAAPEFHTFTVQPEMLEETRSEYLQHAEIRAGLHFEDARTLAAAAGVPFDTAYVVSDTVYVEIIAAAEKHGCDLILMASHGRRGVQAVLLGSETHKVLTHSSIPVLVYRSNS